GTRLGFDVPKGAIAVSPVRDKTLFQLFAETIGAANRRYGLHIPWYIMTSPANHEQTTGFLKDNEFFGLRECDMTLFSQAVLPVFDFDGRILLQDKHRVTLAPDGHGGSLKALVTSGALEDMRSRGVEIISYFQVDNPLVKPLDPLFLGLHAKTGSEMSSKVTPKADDFERVGNLCLVDGRLTVIESMAANSTRATPPSTLSMLPSSNASSPVRSICPSDVLKRPCHSLTRRAYWLSRPSPTPSSSRPSSSMCCR
ncbi:MAG: UTP--glucose-1-phosphate uridylyltransferase, partial [Planctomycetota bacterium]